MSRSIVRTLLIAITCMSVAVLVGVAVAAARGNTSVTWASSAPVPMVPRMVPQDGPVTGSPTSTPANDSNAAQDADGNGVANAETPGSEGSEAGEQNANDVNEQKLAGSVTNIDTSNSTFTLNTATGEVVFTVTSQTQFEDGLTSLSSLQQGMSVRVDGIPQASGQAVAVDVKGPSDGDASENSDASSSESSK